MALTMLTILLGFHTVFKDYVQATTADLIYGTSLRLPGEVFVPIATEAAPQQFIEELKKVMAFALYLFL